MNKDIFNWSLHLTSEPTLWRSVRSSVGSRPEGGGGAYSYDVTRVALPHGGQKLSHCLHKSWVHNLLSYDVAIHFVVESFLYIYTL